MNRFVILASLLLGASGVAAEKGTYLIPKINLTKKSQIGKTLSENEKFVLAEMTIEQVESFSKRMHEEKMTCGGLVNVDDELLAKSSLSQIMSEQVNKTSLQQDIPTQIEHEDVVLRIQSQMSAASYQAELTKLTQFPDRYAAGQGGVDAAKYLKSKVETLASQYNREDITAEFVPTGGRYIQDSVLVRIQGTRSELPAVVIGGHFDTYRNQKPGADDDGSGTATVIEIFNGILKSGVKFERDLYFAFYAAEEWGLHGSKRIVSLFGSRGIQVRGVLQFDMVGYKSPNDSSDLYFVEDNINNQLTSYVKSLAVKYLGIPQGQIGRTLCNYGCSDHVSWHRQGYPAAFPFEASFQNYNRSIHTGRDGMNLVNIEHAYKFVKLGSAFMVEAGVPQE